MSTPEGSERFRIARGAVGYSVYDATRIAQSGLIVDWFRSQCAAEYAARILNSGLATVDPHAIIGCRVVAR